MRSQKGRIRLAALMLGLALLSLAGCGSQRAIDHEQWGSEEKMVIIFSHVVAENTPKGLAARRFANLVREKSKGRIQVEVFPNGQLAGDDEEIQALQDGRVHLIAPSTGKLAGLFPAWQVFDLPYAFPDQEAVVTAMEGPIGQKLFRTVQRRGLRGLVMWDNGWKQMTSSKRPLITPADFAGQRFRVQPSRVLVEQFEALGATAVAVPFDQTFRALETRQVDGQENTPSNIYWKKFHEVQRYLTISNHGYLGYVVLTNNLYWENLPEDARLILTEALAETTAWVRENAGRLNERDLDHIRMGRIEVHFQTEQERMAWKEAFHPVYHYFASEVDSELAQAIRGLERKYGP
ncbi:MAG: TRAP transporter substrate-binding protein [Bacillota bacterium]